MRRILFLLYPAAWRKEYGEEFADVLASQPLGVRMIADVAGSAAWQRLRCVPLWLMCGTFLFAVELYRLYFPLSLPLLHESDPKDVILVMTALWIAVRKGSSLGAAVVGTASAGLLGIMPYFILFAAWNVKAGYRSSSASSTVSR